MVKRIKCKQDWKIVNRREIQIYSCKICNYRFVEDEGFYRMRNSLPSS